MSNVYKYVKALREKTLDMFTLRAIQWDYRLLGNIIASKEGVVFKVINGLEETAQHDLSKQLFAIEFHTNAISFQIQHYALKWMKNHRLIEKLKRNKQYYLIEKASQVTYEIR